MWGYNYNFHYGNRPKDWQQHLIKTMSSEDTVMADRWFIMMMNDTNEQWL